MGAEVRESPFIISLTHLGRVFAVWVSRLQVLGDDSSFRFLGSLSGQVNNYVLFFLMLMSDMGDAKSNPRRTGVSPTWYRCASYQRRWLTWGITSRRAVSRYLKVPIQQSEATSSSFFKFDLMTLSRFQFFP